MHLVVAEQMATKKKTDANEGPYCEYTSIKIDAALMHRLKIAAATANKTVQEHASDLLNISLANDLEKPAIVRLKPRPRKPRED